MHRSLQEQHAKYGISCPSSTSQCVLRRTGPVVRVGPNELSFATLKSWKDIYGHQPSAIPVATKSEFYDMYGSAYKTGCIGSERDPAKHSRMKRNLTAAFSTRALTEQENIIASCVDNFISKIGAADGAQTSGINATKWYEMIAFDILGEMAFGESFHAVDSGKPHFWTELLVNHLFFITLMDNMRRYPLLVSLGNLILPWATISVRNKHSGYTRAKVQQ
jgi:hypothetical protein